MQLFKPHLVNRCPTGTVLWPACSVAQYIISLLVYTCADRWHCRSHNKARNPTPLAATRPALYNHCRLMAPILVGCHGNRLFVPWGSTGSSQAQEYCLRTTSPQTQMCADRLHPLCTAKGVSSPKVARGHATYIDIKMLNFLPKLSDKLQNRSPRFETTGLLMLAPLYLRTSIVTQLAATIQIHRSFPSQKFPAVW